MSVIPKITCRRCGREYSGLRSRCPYCGTSRKKSAERIPLRTSSENAGTPAAEHAAVNTKWQLLFGGILLIAVVAAVIVLITVSLNAEKNSSAAVPAGDRFERRTGHDADSDPNADSDPDADALGHERHDHVPRQQAHGVCGQGR